MFALSEETPTALSALHPSKMYSLGLKHQGRKMSSSVTSKMSKHGKKTSQLEAQRELIRTRLHRTKMVLSTCSATCLAIGMRAILR